MKDFQYFTRQSSNGLISPLAQSNARTQEMPIIKNWLGIDLTEAVQRLIGGNNER